MTGYITPPLMITPDEAIVLFKHARVTEMYRAKDLYDAYIGSRKQSGNAFWEFMSLLSFIYDTGRVQGIREERAKKKGQKRNTPGRITE